MHQAAGAQKVAVAGQEQGRGQAGVLRAAQLGVREGEPDLGHLSGAEEGVDELDAGAQESYVGKGVLRGIFGSFPQAGTLDVHAYVVDIRVPEGQGYGVVSLAAAQFQDYGVAVAKHFGPPAALDGVGVQFELLGAGFFGQHGRCVRLQEAAEGLVLCEFL